MLPSVHGNAPALPSVPMDPQVAPSLSTAPARTPRRIELEDDVDGPGTTLGQRQAARCTEARHKYVHQPREIVINDVTPESEEDDPSIEVPRNWTQRQEWYMLTVNAYDNYLHLTDDQRIVRNRRLKEIKDLILNTMCRAWEREKRRAYEKLTPVMSEDYVGGSEKGANVNSSALATWTGTSADVVSYLNALEERRRTSNWTFKEAVARIRGMKDCATGSKAAQGVQQLLDGQQVGF